MFEFKIIPDEPDAEPFEITAGMRDIRAWEKAFPKRSMGMMSDAATMSATVMFELAYIASKRQGKLPDSLCAVRAADGVEQFVEAYDIALADDEDEEDSVVIGDPTHPAA